MVHYLKHGLVLLVVALLAGWAGTWLGGDLAFKDISKTGLSPFWNRFQVLFIVAVLIERSVETYLNATGQNGEKGYDPVTSTYVRITDASKEAMIAALVLSILVALCGVRIIESLIEFKTAEDLKAAVWHGVDIIVSAGLMAGGSDLFHKLAGVITTGLGRIKDSYGTNEKKGIRSRTVYRVLRPGDPGYSTWTAESTETSRSYMVTIDRPLGADIEEGKLRFNDGGLSITTKCWWDKNNRIDPGTYLRCSKTRMAESDVEAIYLPDAVSKVSGNKSIFIHHGSSPASSLGCFAVTPADFKTLWTHIKPSDAQNITVVIRDI